jgi:hypothetical protein
MNCVSIHYYTLKQFVMNKTAITFICILAATVVMASEKDSLKIGNNLTADFISAESEFFKKDKKKKANLRAQRPLGINLGAFGPGGLVSGSLDGFVTPKIALEGGAGIRNAEADVSYFVGARYHLLGGLPIPLTPYVGVYTAAHNEGRNVKFHSFYVPLGIHRIKRNGFNWSAELAYEKNSFKPENKNLSGSFKIGYRF